MSGKCAIFVAQSANIPDAFTLMAKARVSINPLYTGGAGGYSFYVRKSEQVIRQRKNNSNYGETASRTESQMARRVKWGNLVNLYKDMRSWQPKAYDGKVKGQTDYNLFMSLNINSSQVCLTKDQARNGCAVMDEYQVSRGSLPPITLSKAAGSSDLVSDIAITSAVTSSRTVGDLSADIISHNPQFRNGDNIALICWSQFVDSRQYPYVSCSYSELTLDVSSTVQVGTLEVFRFLSSSNAQFLTIQAPASSFGTYSHGVLIHTRKSDYLQVSTQKSVAIDSSVAARFSGYEWQQQCIDSYGLDEEVPLDPSAGPSDDAWQIFTIESIACNGESKVEGNSFRLPAGDFKFSISPKSWGVPAETLDTDVVIRLAKSSTGDWSTSNSTVVQMTYAEFLAAGGIAPYQFTAEYAGHYFRFEALGSSSVVLSCTVYMDMSD